MSSHGHFIIQCIHGVVVSQCRCADRNKTVIIVPCPASCKAASGGTEKTARWQKQVIFGRGPEFDEPAGDCFRTCLASVLGMRIETVPHYMGHEDWWERTLDWLRGLNLGLVYIHKGEDHAYPLDALRIVSGKTARGAQHVMVYQGQECVHDPHPQPSPFTEYCGVYYVVPLDPAAIESRSFPSAIPGVDA